jgi:serine/threonine-protein kinase
MGELQSIGRYQLLRVIGRGGMGVVYLALDPILQRLAAIKVLSPHLSSDETVIARFINEARIAASLQHPNIVTVYEAGQDGEFVFMAMEYVEGQDLATLLRERGRLHPDEAIAILKAIASALDYAHQRGVIHRDVKPSNVLVSRDGVVKLMDFGIARVIGGERHTKTGVLVGTPEYMAPELWEGKEADKMADLYALGVMAYEMLTGEVPFTGDTPIAVGYKHVHGEVPRTGMGGMVDEVMRVAMAKERERRFQSGTALVTALEKALEGRQEGQRRESFDEAVVERQNFAGVVQSGQSSYPTPTGAIAERKPITQREVNPKVAFFACAVVVLGVILAYWLSYEEPWKRAPSLSWKGSHHSSGVSEVTGSIPTTISKPPTFPKHEEERFEHAYQEALQIAQKIEGEFVRSSTLRDIAEAMAKAGQVNRALQIAQKIEYDRSSALRDIAKAMVEAGQADQANQAFQLAFQIAQKIGDASDRFKALRDIAEAMAKAGQTEQANQAFQLAFQAAQKIGDAWGRSKALSDIAKAMAGAGQVDRVLQIAQKIEYDRSLELRNIAEAMAEAGQLDRALEVAETIDDPIARLQALAAIVAAKREAEKGKSEKGQK